MDHIMMLDFVIFVVTNEPAVKNKPTDNPTSLSSN